MLFPREEETLEDVLAPKEAGLPSAPSSALRLLEEGEERREKKRLPSPDTGFTTVTVQAEVHIDAAPSVQ